MRGQAELERLEAASLHSQLECHAAACVTQTSCGHMPSPGRAARHSWSSSGGQALAGLIPGNTAACICFLAHAQAYAGYGVRGQAELERQEAAARRDRKRQAELSVLDKEQAW